MATFTFTYGYTRDFSQPATMNFNVIGMTGLVTDVSLSLLGLTHSSPDDLDMVLIAPDHVHNLSFWSDAGGSNDLVSADITLSDSAATVLPDEGIITSGIYRPADFFETEDRFYYGFTFDVLHAGPNGGGTFDNAFSGMDPNGEWSLHIRDDTPASDDGLVSDAQLTITTTGSTATLVGTSTSDNLVVTDTGAGTGLFVYNGEFPVAYSGVSGFTLDGGLGNDTISGSSGADVLVGGVGRDAVLAGLGNDFLDVRDGEISTGDIFGGGGDTDTLRLFGFVFDFRVATLVSIERIEYFSGSGMSTFAAFNAAQFGSGISLSATIDGNSGLSITDSLSVSMAAVTSLNLSGLTMLDFSQSGDAVRIKGDGDAEMIIGTRVRDIIEGAGGNDSLNGGLGADSMFGGDGNDSYFANAFDETVEETNSDVATGGNDIVYFTGTSGTFTLSANLERLTLSGTSAINGTGNTLANIIYGNTGANVLDGGADALVDTLIGGLGNDIYMIRSTTDNIVETTGGGTADRAKAELSFALAVADNIEILETANAALTTAINLTGNEIAQTITGNAGTNVLKGGLGKDILDGLGGNDTADFRDKTTAVVVTLAGAATVGVTVGGVAEDSVRNIENLIGGTAADTLNGDDLANILNGGADAVGDTLYGRLGNDIYIINSAADNIIENSGAGTADRAQCSVSFTLAVSDNIEFLETTNAAGLGLINLTGNEIAQTITGNAGNNILSGGTDSVLDTLVGGLGDDTYIINSVNDNIVELAGGGLADRARASISFSLAVGDNIEFLETTNSLGVGAINLTGNELVQTITGNAGVNVLNGGNDADTDTLVGGLGNDTYVINDVNDDIVELVGGGTADRVVAFVDFNLGVGDNIEIMQTNDAAQAGGINLLGNEIAQSITGNAGINILNGEGGNDTLTGGLGVDFFLFNTTPNAASNRDVITDFNVAFDAIMLENAVFLDIGLDGTPLSAALFKNLTTGGPVEADDRILYDDGTGALFYDIDGSAAAVAIQFATLSGSPTLTFDDFTVV